jgi:hypothetical protein
MSYDNTPSQQMYDLLVSRDFDPRALDVMGKPADTPSEADLFSFEYKTPNKNYGTVVILIDSENNMEVYFGDNLGRTMDADDKKDWYDFLYMIRMLAKRNLLTFSLNNLNKLKYNMKTMAAVTEGTLLEGYYGTKKTSYSDQPQKTKLVIKHSRALGEGEQRFRNIESVFVETAEGERFKMPFVNLSGAKAMARHVAEGGNPYDAFGQHIAGMISEMSTLSRFVRAARNRTFAGDAQALAEQAVEHYRALKQKVKKIIGRRGYHEEMENHDPITISDLDQTVDAVREIFVQQTLDPRVEDALPILARIQETSMKEANEFENWANSLVEGTWALPDRPEEIAKLQQLLAEPFPVGADATNATEQLYSIFGDDQLFDDLEELANSDPDADARPIILARLEEMGIDLDQDVADEENLDVEETTDIDTGEVVLKAQRDPMLDDVDLDRLKALIR